MRSFSLPLAGAGPYLGALLFVSIALLIRLWLSSVIHQQSAYFLFGLAVLAAATYGGRGPGLLATASGALVGWYFFIRPLFAQGRAEGYAVQVTSFLIIGLGATLLMDRLRSAKRNAEQAAARNKDNLEAANAGTFDWNIETGEVRWSENMEAIHGQPPGTFDGTSEGTLGFVHPDDRDMVRRKTKLAIEGTGHFDVECRHFRGDGSVGWTEAKGRVIYDERTERPLRMMGVCIDATERKRDEQARMQLAAIVDSSDDTIISADLNGIILTWNAAAGRMYGYTAPEAIGSDITLLFADGCAARKAEILEGSGAGSASNVLRPLASTKTAVRFGFR